MTKPRCAATTKKGTPCKAVPRNDTGLCNAHSPKEVQEASGFGGAQPNSGRPKLPKVTDLARQRVEQAVEALLEPYFRTLGVEFDQAGRVVRVPGAKLVHKDQNGTFVTDIDDLGARIMAAEKLLDRVYGKPRQSTEVTGPDGGPLQTRADLSGLSDEDLAVLAGVLAKTEETETDG